jgi:hypothetical protein
MFRKIGTKRKAAPRLDKYTYPTANATSTTESKTTESKPPDSKGANSSSSKVSRLLETPPQSNNIVQPTYRVRGVLSHALKYSGNGPIWTDVMNAIDCKLCKPFLVWGPTGVGKTFGVKDIADSCGLRVYEIEPSILSSTENLKKWLNHITQSKTLLGPRLILVDVLEGFDVSFLSIFEKFVKKNPQMTVPVVFIADDAFDMSLKNLFAQLPTKFRLFKMNSQRCYAFAKQTFARVPPNDLSIGLMASWDEIVKKACEECDGNLRNLKCRLTSATIQLNHYIKYGGAIPTCVSNNIYFEDMDESLSLFETTNRFLTGYVEVNTWTQCADKATLLHLVGDNYLRFLSDMDNVCKVSEELSSSHMLSYNYHQNFDYDLMVCGLQLKNVCNFDSVPKMTLLSKPRMKRLKSISNVHEYRHSFSRLDTSLLLLDSEIFYS